MNINRSLEELEHKAWHTPPMNSSPAVMRCVALRSTKLRDYSAADIRFMIGQNIGLKYLIPLAIQKISANILLNTGYYEGDLLKTMLTSDPGFWDKNANMLHKMSMLLLAKKNKIESQPDDDFNIKKTLLRLSDSFLERSVSYSY
jgi:hypothetical protein